MVLKMLLTKMMTQAQKLMMKLMTGMKMMGLMQNWMRRMMKIMKAMKTN